MSTISSVGGASSAWADLNASRAGAMRDKMFAKVDSDGSGSVDKSELQTMLDNIQQKTGQSLGSADDLMKKMDSDGNGSLSEDELSAGMKSLMPPPSSTMDFAQQRADDGAPGTEKPHHAHARAHADAADSSSSSSTSTDPLDTNGDGVVSPEERAAGDMQDLMKNLMSALDSNGDGSVSSSEADSFKSQMDATISSLQANAGSGASSSSDSSSSSSSRQNHLDLSALVNLLQKEYGQTAPSSAGSGSANAALNVAV